MRKKSQVPDLFTPDGFVAAQMIVQALKNGDDDVDKMITALEGWKFLGPKGWQRDPPAGSRDAAADVPVTLGQVGQAARRRRCSARRPPYETAPPITIVLPR